MTGLDPTARFLIGLAVLLALSRGAAALAVRLGQPPVLAEILTGVALGPSLLGRVLPAVHTAFFGPSVMPLVGGLAQVGLALYAFEIGSHLAAPRPGARDTAQSVLWVAGASLLVPAGAGLALAPALYARGLAGPHGSVAALAVFLACAMGVTAVPVLARLLQDRGLENSRVGRLALVAACLGDAVCWCLLAVALRVAGLVGTVQMSAGALGAAVAVVLIHRRHTHPPGGTEDKAWGLGPLLAAVCLAAGASAAMGLHPMLGGLLLGAAWPASRWGANLARGVRSMASVLLPCFFLGTGQQIDVSSALSARGFVPLVGVLLAGAVATKLVACTAVGALRGLPRREALRLGVLMNAKGLTEIVVLSVGFQAGLIGRTLFEALVVVALVTTVLAGPALVALDRRAPAGGPQGPARPGTEPGTEPGAVPDAGADVPGPVRLDGAGAARGGARR